jgi:hypothetical protein
MAGKAGSTLAANSRGIKRFLSAHSWLVCYPLRQDAAIAA